jgi:hypothetical protein
LFDYINSGKANLIVGGAIVIIVALGVVIALAISFSGHTPGTAWEWYQKLVVWSLVVVGASGATLGILALQPSRAIASSLPLPTQSSSTPPSVTAPITTDPPSTTAEPPNQVSWIKPVAGGTSIAPKQNVTLLGNVSGVAEDHTV